VKRKKPSGSLLQQIAWEYGQDIRAIRGVIVNLKLLETRLSVDMMKDFKIDLPILGAMLEGLAQGKYQKKRSGI
jgi:hypothetical protein